MFLSPDTVAPDAGTVIDYNRFLYARGNPLLYNDPDGHRVKFPCPLCDQTLFDYSNQKGLADKAIDVVATVGCFFIGCHVDREANQVTGPSVEEAANAAVLGMINPIGMVNVPGAGEGLEQAGEQALKGLTRRNFRENLRRFTGQSQEAIKGLEVHHVLPQKFENRFQNLGIGNIHDPLFGSWVEKTPHRQWSRAYNNRWKKFLNTNPAVDQILDFARQLGKEYNFDVHFK
jgi:hypothetical protein